MFFLAIPALLEVIVTAVVATFATKAASDFYDHVKGSRYDSTRNSHHAP